MIRSTRRVFLLAAALTFIDELLAYGLARMKEYAIVDGGDAKTLGLLTMTDVRWLGTIAFLRSAGLANTGADYAKAWTLDVVSGVKVLP